MIECESDHEAHFAILAELDPNVTHIFSQPFQWSHWFEGRKRQHWPDFALVVAGQAEIHEVKELVRRHNIWHRSLRRLVECRPRLGVDVRRRACGVASAD
ncbi:MAG: hypothetical protein J0G94_06095, partial [Sphingomonadales bacterium]|nr:hypothetical protein [Sphingomonadales bacterium]